MAYILGTFFYVSLAILKLLVAEEILNYITACLCSAVAGLYAGLGVANHFLETYDKNNRKGEGG